MENKFLRLRTKTSLSQGMRFFYQLSHINEYGSRFKKLRPGSILYPAIKSCCRGENDLEYPDELEKEWMKAIDRLQTDSLH